MILASLQGIFKDYEDKHYPGSKAGPDNVIKNKIDKSNGLTSTRQLK